MNDAEKIKLKWVSSIVPGHPFRGSIPMSSDSGVKVVQMKDLKENGQVDWSATAEVSIETKKTLDWLSDGDILFAARSTRNIASLIENCPPNILAAPYFYVIRLNHKKVLPKFLVWQLNQGPLQKYFQREAEGSMTKSIKKSSLEEVEIAVPSIDAQQKIINMAEIFEREKKICQKLINNGESIMNSIAVNILNKQH
ncbi:MAG: restriction endonuclease subunit S [Methylotenera sp.]|nr:restriction endonuclease subunit S [Methylotenera sp.]MDP1754666.1 restriction endonuclease subunit S [Methylotenera sp.]MDP2101568.1 restriction endonuclease subunit S [Methylotenera sp.]MDP2404272.1 restriction endonuclease subunit S [Methylotenera sp.]MDP3095935.1 restriction endonuclease subunit S [Methylotenera sp.]